MDIEQKEVYFVIYSNPQRYKNGDGELQKVRCAGQTLEDPYYIQCVSVKIITFDT